MIFVCLCKAYAKKAALKNGLDKTVSLRKDLSEMHEWITQAEEEYLERDFEYKTPDELQKAVEELKVKMQKDSFNLCALEAAIALSACSVERVTYLSTTLEISNLNLK